MTRGDSGIASGEGTHPVGDPEKTRRIGRLHVGACWCLAIALVFYLIDWVVAIGVAGVGLLFEITAWWQWYLVYAEKESKDIVALERRQESAPESRAYHEE